MPLHHEVVQPTLLDVLRSLQQWPELRPFYLVGGTGLALHLGHRRSIDIDLFTHTPFASQPIADRISAEMRSTQLETGRNLVRCFIDGIKVDILAHQYPLLEPAYEAESLRIASLPDIAAMKLNALTNRGARKDFWDVAALLNQYPLATMLDFHARKYGNMNRFSVLKSLCYFADADAETVPVLDYTGTTWEAVKARIESASTTLLRNQA